MYRLLSAHILALIDDSVITIEMCSVVPCGPRAHRPLIPSLGPLTSPVCCPVKCLPRGIGVTTVGKDIRYSVR